MFPDLTIDELGKQTHSKASKIIKTKKTKVLTSFVNLFWNEAFLPHMDLNCLLVHKHTKKTN